MGNKQGKDDSEGQDKVQEREHPNEAVERLSLVYRELRALPDELFAKGKSLKSLDISHNKLTDTAVNKLGGLEQLTTLVADNNRFLKFYLPSMSSLTFLSLNSNRISDLESIAVVLSTRCPQLRTLSLTNNPCCPSYELQQKFPEAQNQYRCFIVGHFKNLKTLDCTDVTQQEREKSVQLLEDIADGKVKLSSLLEDPSSAVAKEEKKKKNEEERKRKKKERKEKKKKKEKKEKKGKKDKAKDTSPADEEPAAPSSIPGPPPIPQGPPPLPDGPPPPPPPPPPADEDDDESDDMPPPPPPRSENVLPLPEELRNRENRPPPPPPPPEDSDSGSDWSDGSDSSDDSDDELNEVFQKSTMIIPSEPSQKTLVLTSAPAPPPPPPPASKPAPTGNIWSSDEED